MSYVAGCCVRHLSHVMLTITLGLCVKRGNVRPLLLVACMRFLLACNPKKFLIAPVKTYPAWVFILGMLMRISAFATGSGMLTTGFAWNETCETGVQP